MQKSWGATGTAAKWLSCWDPYNKMPPNQALEETVFQIRYTVPLVIWLWWQVSQAVIGFNWPPYCYNILYLHANCQKAGRREGKGKEGREGRRGGSWFIFHLLEMPHKLFATCPTSKCPTFPCKWGGMCHRGSSEREMAAPCSSGQWTQFHLL